MAVSLHSTGSSSCLHSGTELSRPSLSCATKVFSGLKLQSASPLGAGRPNLTAEFYGKVHRSINARTSNNKASRARVSMMPIGTPRVPYRTPGEGTWQWVDLWNALGFCDLLVKKFPPTKICPEPPHDLRDSPNGGFYPACMSLDYRERVIFIGQHIDEEFSNQILATMLYLDSVDSAKRLYLYINGPGGDLTPSMAIYDTMQSLQSPVGTHCVGYAYNLAGFLLAAGEKGNRFAMPLSRIALQSPAGAARGQADDIQNEANELLRIRDYLFRELATKTGQPIERINKDLGRMKRFNAQEALEYGLIDRIVRPPRIKADAPRKDAGTGLG